MDRYKAEIVELLDQVTRLYAEDIVAVQRLVNSDDSIRKTQKGPQRHRAALRGIARMRAAGEACAMAMECFPVPHPAMRTSSCD